MKYDKNKNENSKRNFTFAFKVFDTNQDGHLTFMETAIGLAFSESINDLNKRLDMTFDLFDADQSGFIEKNEILRILRIIHEFESNPKDWSPQSVIEDLFNTYDYDKDGNLNKKEFIRYLLNDEKIRNSLIFL